MHPKHKSQVYNNHHYNKNLPSCWVFLIKTQISYKPRSNSAGPQLLFFMSPPTFGFGYFSTVNQRIGAPGTRGCAEEGLPSARGNHPQAAGTPRGPGQCGMAPLPPRGMRQTGYKQLAMLPECQASAPPDPADSVILVCSSRCSICLYLLLAGKIG